MIVCDLLDQRSFLQKGSTLLTRSTNCACIILGNYERAYMRTSYCIRMNECMCTCMHACLPRTPTHRMPAMASARESLVLVLQVDAPTACHDNVPVESILSQIRLRHEVFIGRTMEKHCKRCKKAHIPTVAEFVTHEAVISPAPTPSAR